MKHVNSAVDTLIYLLAKLSGLIEKVTFGLANWRTRESKLFIPESEADTFLDEPEEDGGYLSFRRIDLGDFYVHCPECDEPDNVVLMGIQLINDDDASLDFTTVGMIVYSCGDIVYSPCLTERIGHILNACDEQALTPEMFLNLEECEEHEVLYTEE